jgi:hypothetical protein
MTSSLISSCWSCPGPMISQDPSPASTVAPSGGSRGNPLRHDCPSWPADMHIIRGGGGLGWAGRRRGVGLLSRSPRSRWPSPAACPHRALPTLSGAHARELDHQRSARVNRWELVCGCISRMLALDMHNSGLWSVSRVMGV